MRKPPDPPVAMHFTVDGQTFGVSMSNAGQKKRRGVIRVTTVWVCPTCKRGTQHEGRVTEKGCCRCDAEVAP